MAFIKDGKIRFSVKLTIVISLFLSVLIISYTQKKNYLFKRERCQLICQTAANQFQTDLNNYIIVNDILEAMLLETQGNLLKFNRIAENLMNRLPAIDSIQLAPKGTVEKAFPEQNIHNNLFDNPETKIGSNYALQTKKAYLTGPVSNGKDLIIIIQHPVFLPDENGTQRFWGFIVLHLNLENLFQQETLTFLKKSGYSYCLWKPDPQSSEVSNLAWNTSEELDNPCQSVFKITNTLWTLNVMPEEGWISIKLIIIKAFIAIFICISLSIGITVLVSLKDRDEALERLSYRDPLTNLFNKRKYISTLKELEKQEKPFCLIYMDLNDFKYINDNFGHEAGDQVLIIAARKLANCIRESDSCYRIGGDEFAVILSDSHDHIFINNVITRIKDSVKKETILTSTRLEVSISAGYARFPEDAASYEEIIKMADIAMYEDKREMKEVKQSS